MARATVPLVAELLEQGSPERPPRPGLRRAVRVVAALAVVGLAVPPAAGWWQDRQERARRDDAVELGAAVLGAQDLADAQDPGDGIYPGDAERAREVLVTVRLSGPPGARLRDVVVALPGSRVGVLPPPDRLGPDGTVRLVLRVTPECPQAVAGVDRGAVSAVVAPASGRRREVSTPLPALGPLGEAVRRRCGTPDPFQRLLLNDLVLRQLPGAPDGRVRTVLALRGPLRVDGLVPLPGLDLDNVTPVPLALGADENRDETGRLVVDVGIGDCPSVPTLPPGELSPYALRVGARQVEPLVEPDLQRSLVELVASRCRRAS